MDARGGGKKRQAPEPPLPSLSNLKDCQPFAPKKRNTGTVKAQDKRRVGHPLNFTWENPEGKLWELPFMKRFVANEFVKRSNGGGVLTEIVFQRKTSYCQYDSPFEKPTRFVTSLPDLELAKPCVERRCAISKGPQRKHPAELQGQSSATKNAIPTGIIFSIFEAWTATYSGSKPKPVFVLFDAFAGFGSTQKAADAWNKTRGADEQIKVVQNDILRSRGDVTINMQSFSLRTAIGLILGPYLGASDSSSRPAATSLVSLLRENRIALLIHLSTPCETYSRASGCVHRARGSADPLTPKAEAHDVMNERLVSELQELLLEGADEEG